ncbi:hypothetical protein KO528_16800 [Saccharophagus degradans]|nr:hypothetical protein [Saccharophagus degradans]
MGRPWTRFKRYCVLGCVAFLSVLASAGEVKNSGGGMLDFNFYPYLSKAENDSVFSLNMASGLPNRFSYFGFINFYNQQNENELQDTVNFYSELNLRWKVAETSPFDLTLQQVMRSSEDNDRTRLGVRWRLNNTSHLEQFFQRIHAKWSINLHAVQFDDTDANEWQLEHAYSFSFPSISKRLYVAGFIDHTFNEDLPPAFPSNPIVSETQVGWRIVENFYAIYEYRINQYRIDSEVNHAVGVEYKMKW